MTVADDSEESQSVERVAFSNARGLQLIGDLYTADSDRVVILSHGYTSDRGSRGRFPRMATALNEAAFNVLAFDYAGCGESEDDILHPEKLVEDLSSAIGFTQSLGYQGIAIYGHSLGATLALQAYSDAVVTMVLSGAGTGPIQYDWSQYHSQEQLLELARTGLLSVPAGGDIARTAVIHHELLDSFESIDSEKLLSRVHCPVLLIHGDSEADEEERLLLERSLAALKYLQKGSQLTILHGAGHSFTNHYDEVIRLTVSWLNSRM